MKNKANILLVGLVVVAAFLAGSVWTKMRVGSEKVKTIEKVEEEIPASPEFNPPKSEKPVVKFFVMSFCPFGNQAEAGLKPVYDLLKDKVEWQPRYIVSRQGQNFVSLHGKQELNQDVRELCVLNLQGGEKYWQFVEKVNQNCDYQTADKCWTGQAQAVGVKTSPVSSCQETQAEALLAAQIEEVEKYQAYGSPMVFVNEELYDGGRAPEDYKLTICSAFESEPPECATVLSETSEAAAGGCQ